MWPWSNQWGRVLLEENFQIYTKPLKQNGLRKLEVSRWKAKLEAIRYMISKSDGSCLTEWQDGRITDSAMNITLTPSMGHINKQIINLFRFLWLTATLIFYQAESDADHSFTEKCFDKRVFNYFLFLLYREIQYIFSICFSRSKLFFIFLYLTSFRFMLLYIFKYKDKGKNTFWIYHT